MKFSFYLNKEQKEKLKHELFLLGFEEQENEAEYTLHVCNVNEVQDFTNKVEAVRNLARCVHPSLGIQNFLRTRVVSNLGRTLISLEEEILHKSKLEENTYE
jgi:hypothetical protein